jgi:hypothetical protein
LPDAATRWGDRIDYVVLGTADGRTIRARPGADRVRLAGVEADDELTLRFEGSRAFDIVPAVVGRGGILTIEHPDQHRADGLVFSLLGGGGLRRVWNGGGSTAWNPYGEVDILATIRELRMRTGDFYVDPELRVGAIFTTNAYEWLFTGNDVDDHEHWSNVPVLFFPIEASLHCFGNQRFHFGPGGGVMLSRELFADDAPRVSNPLKAFLGLNFGLGVTRAFAIDFDFRAAFGNDVVKRTFTDGGVGQTSNDTSAIVFLGARARFDDAFEGTLTRSSLADASKPATKERAPGEQQQALKP